MFKKILIANRGEIAVRIIRACRELGIDCVTVHSTADRESLHVLLAEESYCIGPPQLGKSYLNQDAILQVALSAGAEAIHPGYGILSENPEFARRVEEAGLVFIGPTADHIKAMGNKEEARKRMKEARVPVIEGHEDLVTGQSALEAAKAMGFPVMIKASAGGGGKGIRVIRKAEDFLSQWQLAKGEAQATFGDDSLYLERFVEKAKHIEVQLLSDGKGNHYALGERDCSVQRRHQKLIEESPCSILEDHHREKLAEYAVAAAKALNYRGVGTVEFLMDDDYNFFFLEMNTRLQVEHPVTEMVTSEDLVQLQIRIAAGEVLDQYPISLGGHAIECRILAENPRQNYAPSFGDINFFHQPGGPMVRFDSFLYAGTNITPYYDSLLGKLIVWAPDREAAIRKMRAALGELIIQGIDTNCDYYLELLSHPSFLSGRFHTEELTNE